MGAGTLTTFNSMARASVNDMSEEISTNDVIVTGTLTAAKPVQGDIIFTCQEGSEEMLRIKPEGFYVRGQKVPQDEGEAVAVYDAFIVWFKTTGFYPR